MLVEALVDAKLELGPSMCDHRAMCFLQGARTFLYGCEIVNLRVTWSCPGIQSSILATALGGIGCRGRIASLK